MNVPENAGNATVNGEAIIEGGVGSVYRGGATPDDADNSGILRFVRIEYGGIAYQPNSEINGLTLGGVGSGNTIDHVQVSFCGDDAFEFFGGTVNATHLIAYRNGDDDFDTDFGYRGKIQFAISVRDPQIADQSGSNGFESDNDGQGAENTPITNAIFSNVTILGPKLNAADTLINGNYKRALHLRRSTRTSVFNSVFTGYPKGLVIDGGVTCNNASDNLLRFRNNRLCGMAAATEAASGVLNIDSLFSAGSNSSDDDLAALMFGSTNLDSPDLMPAIGSPLLSGADFTDSYLSNGFTATTYIGALGTDDWTAQWKSFTCQTNPYLAAPPANVASIESNSLNVYPNPANDMLSLESLSHNILEVLCYSLDGRMVATNAKVFGPRAVVDVSALPGGVYLMKAALEGGNVVTSRITVSH